MRTITKGSTVLSVLLWFLAAYFWSNGLVAGFGIVGILAVLAQVIGVNSAQLEGRRSVGDPTLKEFFGVKR